MLSEKRATYLAALLFFLLAIVAAFTFRDYGITWDENFQYQKGNSALEFYRSILQGNMIEVQRRHGVYGMAFQSIANLLSLAVPSAVFETRHLFNALIGLLGIVGCWAVACRVHSKYAALWAALFLALTPSWYGHMFNNSKDIPFATGYVWTLYFILTAISFLPRIPARITVPMGIVLGSTLAVRIGGALLVVYFVIVVVVYILSKGRAYLRCKNYSGLVSEFVQLGKSLSTIFVIAYGVMILFWPWTWKNPFINPFLALRVFSDYRWGSSLLFDGEVFKDSGPPAEYIPHMLAIKLPELILIVLLLGAVSGFVLIWKSRHKFSPKTVAPYGVVFLSIIFPIVYVILKGSQLYDGVRHFLFVVPSIVVLAAVCMVHLQSCIARSRNLLIGVTIIVGVYGLYHISLLVALHPYQYIYYNAFVGGLQGAYGRYETDYWGGSYKEGVNKLEEYLRAENGENFAKIDYELITASNALSSTYFFPPNFHRTKNPDKADYYLATTRANRHKRFANSPVLFTVDRLGVPLLYVVNMRGRERDQ